jgi:aminopeptidase N
MMAVGGFNIYNDTWRGKEVSYYLEPKYAHHAKDIFGFTPEAMEFFSKTLGVDFPWSKYAQIRVRDYVSGAMENTSATMYGEDGKITKRELADRDFYESGAVHELFHQWFGDYVTTESWSNLTLNESFANLGEILWAEYKLGKDVADEKFFQWVNGYLGNPDDWGKSLVRFHYEQEQDLFDGVTFSKGSCILNMLRKYLGNDAFYAGLRNYLQKNAFKAAEAHHLRLAMEEVSGKDLNWFFNQWYFGAGHPVLDIQYKWNDDTKMQTIYLKQTQDSNVFTLPISIDIYTNGKTERYVIWMLNKADTFNFRVNSKPDLVNVDAEKILLARKTDNKTINEYKFQYTHAPLYIDRYEAIEAAMEKQAEDAGQQILIAALKDKFYGLRSKAINALNMTIPAIRDASIPILTSLAQNDKNNIVRADAITALGNLKDSGNAKLFKQALKSESYAIQGASLNAFALLNPKEAMALAEGLENNSKGKLTDAIIDIYGTYGSDEQWPYVFHQYTDVNSPTKYSFTLKFAEFTGRVANPEYAQKGVEAIKSLVTELKRFNISAKIIERLNEIKVQRQKLNDNVTSSAIDKAIIEIQVSK